MGEVDLSPGWGLETAVDGWRIEICGPAEGESGWLEGKTTASGT